jgi:hypothetical protein
MGSHAKPRTTGRRTAIGALALGATLTGVGLTAAALDPATAVLTASGPGDGGQTQLSGLGGPVGMDLSPAADGIQNLASAPLANIGALTNAVNGTASGALESAGSVGRTATSGTLDISTKAPAAQGTQNGIKPIEASSVTSGTPSGASSGTPAGGYSAKHAKTRSAPPPSSSSGTAPLASAATSGLTSTATSVLPLGQNLVGEVPVVSGLVQGSGVTGTASGLLGTASGTVGGTVDGASGDPVSGAVGGLPLVGSLLGGSGDGQSTLSVPNVSSLTGSLGGLV